MPVYTVSTSCCSLPSDPATDPKQICAAIQPKGLIPRRNFRLNNKSEHLTTPNFTSFHILIKVYILKVPNPNLSLIFDLKKERSICLAKTALLLHKSLGFFSFWKWQHMIGPSPTCCCSASQLTARCKCFHLSNNEGNRCINKRYSRGDKGKIIMFFFF